MNVFEFNRLFRLGIQAARLPSAVSGDSIAPKVVVRLKDGSELPVTAVKVRAGTIILETFVDG